MMLTRKPAIIASVLFVAAVASAMTAAIAISQSNAPSECIEMLSGGAVIDGEWDANCLSHKPAPQGSGDRRARFYTFTLYTETQVAISLTSDADAHLYLLAGHGADGEILHENNDHDAEAFDLAAPTDAGISQTLRAGDYTIEATTHAAKNGGGGEANSPLRWMGCQRTACHHS